MTLAVTTQDSKCLHKIGDKHTTCSKCGEPTRFEIDMMGTQKTVKINCSCDRKRIKEQEERQQHIDEMALLNKLRSVSIMDKDFDKSTFQNAQVGSDNHKYFKMAQNYVDRWEEMLERNIGLIFHGEPGCGKTYLVSCIGNALLDKRQSVVVVNVNGLLNKLKETYKRFGNESDYHIINSLKNTKLLIIDDLGAERATDWTTGKLYEIIDSRYRDKKPVIFTTNLSPDKLRNHLSQDGVSRTYDRMGEMCTPIQMNSKPRRANIANEKMDIVRELF